LVYVVYRQGYVVYYAQFGTTPDEMGITETTILSHAALPLVTLGAGAILILLLCDFVIFTLLRPYVADVQPTLVLIVLTAFLALVGVWTQLVWHTHLYAPFPEVAAKYPAYRDMVEPRFTVFPMTTVIVVTMLALVIVSVASLVARHRYRHRPPAAVPGAVDWWMRSHVTWIYFLGAIGYVVAFLGLLTFVTANATVSAYIGASQRPPSQLEQYTGPFFGYGNDVVCVTWIAMAPAPLGLNLSSHTPFNYLGTNNGDVILYERTSNMGIVRVPSSTVALTPPQPRSLCT
jgi:hypothetical protein